MLQYSFAQWVFIFCMFSVVGFIWETVYCSLREGKLLNRGFMKGPFLPIYGFGVCVMLIAAAPFPNLVVMGCLSGTVCATVMEYVTGDLMEHLFKVRYWDYSKEKFNLNGHICLGASLVWFLASFLVNRIAKAPVEKLMDHIGIRAITIIDWIVMTVAVIDFAISFKAAMDLRIVLVKMEEARHEMKLMQKRLDVIIAILAEEAGDKYEEFTSGVSEKYDEFTDSVSEKFDRIGDFGDGVKRRLEYAKDKTMELGDKIMPDSGKKMIEEISGMKDKYAQVLKKYTSSLHPGQKIKNFFIGNIIRSNPTLTSDEYAEALEELKKGTK